MKLGIAYNAFDGLELLEASIDTVRPVADFICVVYQTTSNFGEAMSERDSQFLRDLERGGKVDMFSAHVPIPGGGHANEIAKRNAGKYICKNNWCTHHMTIDVDELYVTDQLRYAKSQMESGDWDASACKMQTYWKTPSYVLDPPEEYYVPLIYTLDNRSFDLRNRWTISADPTRRLVSNKIRVFERSEIEMHHLSYVRLDIGSKLRNSSASVNFRQRIPQLVDYYENWSPGMQANLAGKEERRYNLRKVNPLFEIKNVKEL